MLQLVINLLIFSIPLRYHTYNEVLLELDYLRSLYPNLIVIETIGVSSIGGTPILCTKISDNPLDEEDEPAILFVGVHHAEEIMGCEMVMYIINQLLSNYGQDSLLTKFVNELEIYLVPILNPDGHEIVMNEIDITWRKNLRDNNGNGVFDPDYDGVDLNRNYGFNWELGGSTDPSSEYYRGPAPFSELETQAIRNLSFRKRFILAIDFHSARTGQGEIIYYPWRWGSRFSVDYPFLRYVGNLMASSIVNDNRSGTYAAIYGSATEGNFRNWLYATFGTYAYTLEISWGCILPEEMVDDVLERVFEGVKVFLNTLFRSVLVVSVFDAESGTPLEAEVRIEGYYDSTLTPRTTDPVYGKFRKVMVPGTYNILIYKENYEPVYLSNVYIGESPLELLITMTNIEEGRGNNLRFPFDIKPFENKLILTIDSDYSDLEDFSVYDPSGRLLFSTEVSFSKSPLIIEISVDRSFRQGLYFGVLRNGKYHWVKRFFWIN